MDVDVVADLEEANVAPLLKELGDIYYANEIAICERRCAGVLARCLFAVEKLRHVDRLGPRDVEFTEELVTGVLANLCRLVFGSVPRSLLSRRGLPGMGSLLVHVCGSVCTLSAFRSTQDCRHKSISRNGLQISSWRCLHYVCTAPSPNVSC